MTRYSKELKESLIRRMLPPTNTSIPELAQETGIPRDTLYGWRLAARQGAPDGGGSPTPASGGLDGEAKLSVVLETAALNEHELSEYCRQKGLYPEQVRAWRERCVQANRPYRRPAEREEARRHAKTIKQLQAELWRKDRALAEAAALLVLEKKVQGLWGEPEDARSSSRSESK